MDNRFECEVCLQKYNTENRIPKFLNCFHTFCLSCLQCRVSNDSVICPTCSNETPLNSLPVGKALQTNPYILTQLGKDGNAAASEDAKTKAETNIVKKRYFWCSSCSLTVQEGENCCKNHTVHDLETEDGREFAEVYLKTLFVTCKSQWNSALTKNQETVSALKSVQAALQTVQEWAGTQRKEAERQTKQLQKNLSEVGNHLKPQADKQTSGEEIHNLFEKYKDSAAKMKEEQTNPNTFDSLRNATVAMEIKTADGKKIAAPLFNSATLNFPSKGAEEQESHLLTALSFLILTGSHSGNWTAPTTHKKPKEGKMASQATPLEKGKTKAPKNEQKAVADEGGNKSKFEKKKATNTDPNQAPQKKSIESNTPPNIGAKSKPPHHTHADTPRPNHPKSKPPSVKAFERREPINQPSNFHQAPHDVLKGHPGQPSSLPQVLDAVLKGVRTVSDAFNVPPPSFIPPLTSLHNKKTFLALAVNGKQYGTIVIELRPDVAPNMCQRFAQTCLATGATGFQGTTIFKTAPKTYIMGGRLPGPESVYIADLSPLKKTRGAIFLRLKRDFNQVQCSIVSSEFCIQLSEDADKFRTSTVFGFVVDGLAVCDAISHMDCGKDHIAIASAGFA